MEKDITKDDLIEPQVSTTHSQEITNCVCHSVLPTADSDRCRSCNQLICIIDNQKQECLTITLKVEKLKSQLKEKQSFNESIKQQLQDLQTTYDKRQQDIKIMIERIDSIEQDIQTVRLKHQVEVAHTKAIEQSKKIAQVELQDLTQKLFEEANVLVFKEQQEKEQLQKQYDDLEHVLTETERQLNLIQTELEQLREKMTHDEEIKTAAINRPQLDMSMLFDQKQPVEVRSILQDQLVLDEFAEFIASVRTVPMTKLSNLSFMKVCLKSDIKPCLQMVRKISIKRVIDAIISKTCLIEPCSKKVDPSFIGCHLCGRTLEEEQERLLLRWRFRLSYFDEWALMDKHCRDRMVSVMEFYDFIRRIKHGYYDNHTILDIYQECSRLRLRMFISR
ncbi:hypothetical protein BCV72DRAFT_206352 [Rhizopus microsporus var. microsporus]|uniref:GDP/GTP exchange factor Sec2 N-terminal domain-containing protein n=1 Tax=Rhizopus microsporus var. microsporus TaxID=86635 RepID=A0A1X0R4J4_RHIZD|nr:hypothetical protein BCV72DRAFT_206352 [Rhizopus microsporus var. microsporus]